MLYQSFRGRLRSSAALPVVALAAALSFGFPASAQSICTVDATASPNTFDCTGGIGADASGTFSDEAWFLSTGYGTLAIIGGNALEVALSGGVVEASNQTAIYLYSQTGSLTYQSAGTAQATGASSTILNGVSVVANTGTVIANGDYVKGVWSVSTAGNNSTTGGTTSVSGTWATGLWIDALNGGHNITNTGSVTATGERSRGVVARALPSGSCDSNQNLDTTINVTGDVTAAYIGVQALTCGDGTINVQAGRTVTATTGVDSFAVINIAAGVAETNVDGAVLAFSSAHRSIDARGASSTTSIGSTGYVRGTFMGDVGNDAVSIASGGIWLTSGTSEFRGGIDSVINSGTLIAQGVTTMAALESFSNAGAINLQNGVAGDSLTLDGDYVGNAGASFFVDVTGSTADQLIVQGAISGTTTLNVNAFGEIFSDPILVVDVITSSAGAFQLGTVTGDASPFVDFSLTQNGADYFLVAAPSAATMQAASVSRVSTDLWHRSAGLPRVQKKQRRTPMRFWGQLQNGRGSDGDIDRGIGSGRRGSELGVDMSVGDRFVLGFASGFQGIDGVRVSGPEGVYAKGHSLGLYAQFGASTGFYADLLFKKDWNDVRLTDSAFARAGSDPDSTSAGVQAGGGYRWEARSVGFDVGGSLAYVRTKIRSFTAEGIDFDFGEGQSLRGEFGAGAQFSGRLAPFVNAKVYSEFAGNHALALSNGRVPDSVEIDGRRTWARLEAGFGSDHGPGPMLSGWADIGGDSGLGMRASVRF